MKQFPKDFEAFRSWEWDLRRRGYVEFFIVLTDGIESYFYLLRIWWNKLHTKMEHVFLGIDSDNSSKFGNHAFGSWVWNWILNQNQIFVLIFHSIIRWFSMGWDVGMSCRMFTFRGDEVTLYHLFRASFFSLWVNILHRSPHLYTQNKKCSF